MDCKQALTETEGDVDAAIKPKTPDGLNKQTSCTQQLKMYLAPKNVH